MPIKKSALECAILDYEMARQKRAELIKKRAKLLDMCEKDTFCLSAAYKKNRLEKEHRRREEYFLIDYLETLTEGVASGEFCATCLKAYKMKGGSIFAAGRRLGQAKRNLTYLGKQLIAEWEKEKKSWIAKES
jgi:U3 small nucleolar RNA-associated protein 14